MTLSQQEQRARLQETEPGDFDLRSISDYRWDPPPCGASYAVENILSAYAERSCLARAQAGKVHAPSSGSFLGSFSLNCNSGAFKRALESIRWPPSSNSEICQQLCSVHMGLTSVPGARSSSDHSAASPWTTLFKPLGRCYWAGDVWALSPSFQETPANVLWGSAAAACTVRPESDSIGLSSFDSQRWGYLTLLIKQGRKWRSKTVFFLCSLLL